MWASKKNKGELNKIYNELLNQYIPAYDEFMSGFIKDNFFSSIGSRQVYSELLQLYSDFDIIPDEDNHYMAYLNKIKDNFDINCNILEVASGSVPALANIIASEQLKTGNGTITIYEPNLISTTPKYSNMKLYKEEFNSTIDIKQFDLVVSIMPCLVTEDIIEQVFKNDKDFYLAFCGCDHYGFSNPFYGYMMPIPSYYQYLTKVNELNKEYNLGDIITDRLPDKYEIDYPIVYNKRKKKI